MAIASLKESVDVHVKWEPYLLKEIGQYAVPKEGRPMLPIGAEPTFHKLADRGKEVGIDMTGDVTRVPNTRLLHQLSEWAYEQNPAKQHELKELIFQAYYSKNIYLGEIENLVSLAQQVGYDGEAARAHLQSGVGEAEVVKKSDAYKRSGVNGIPFFVIGKQQFSGAQDPSVFQRVIREACSSR